MATEVPDGRLTQAESADANVFIDSNTTDLTTILGEFSDYAKGPASAVDSRIAAYDGTTGKLLKDGGKTIAETEASTSNVTAAGAVMDSELTSETDVKALNQSVVSGAAPTFTGTNLSGTAAGLTVGATTGVEAGADVTDTANVTAAGALMDSELTDIAAVKALNQGVATTDNPQFATVELGHATDTTLSRSAAGVLAVEGKPQAAVQHYEEWPIEPGAWAPYTTGGATATETVYGSNEFDSFSFDSASEEAIRLQIKMPQDYNGGTIRWNFDWDALATASGTIVAGLSAGSFGDSDALSTALGTERTITDTLITVGDNHQSPNDATGVTIAGTPVAGDLVLFKFVCKTSGTIAVNQLINQINLQYQTKTTQPGAYA